MDKKYNDKHAGVKRLMREAMELSEPTDLYHAQPIDDNLFEWHFTVRGPPDTEFQGGIYHGRISFPPDYPMKPPSIFLLTKTGRFEVNKKICLSISGYHPETWLPSWSVRTALLAIIGFMPSKGEGAVGSLDYTPEERRVLAKQSLLFRCERCAVQNSKILKPLAEGDSKTQAELKEAKGLIIKSEKPQQDKQPSESALSPSSSSQPSSDSNSGINSTTTSSSSSSSRQSNKYIEAYSKSQSTSNSRPQSSSPQMAPTQNPVTTQPNQMTTNPANANVANESMPLIISAVVVLVAIVALIMRRLGASDLLTDDFSEKYSHL